MQKRDRKFLDFWTYNTTTARIKAVNPGLIINENFIREGYYIYIPV